jgi:peroxiredoxin
LSDLVGQQAPDFTLRDQDGKKVTLSELRGESVVLVFYPLDWSPVCTDQLNLYEGALADFGKQGASLYGISVDSAFSHKAFQNHLGINFPLLADFEPKGAVARAYGVYREKDGISERALFLIDAEGIIRWSYLSPIGVNPGADGVLAALEALPSPTPTAANTEVKS